MQALQGHSGPAFPASPKEGNKSSVEVGRAACLGASTGKRRPDPQLAGLNSVDTARAGVSAVVAFTDIQPATPLGMPGPLDPAMILIHNGILQARNLQLAARQAHDKTAEEYATILLHLRLDYLVTLTARRRRAALGPR